jgi:glycosyltransferase involved in cell wall biosynthesis
MDLNPSSSNLLVKGVSLEFREKGEPTPPSVLVLMAALNEQEGIGLTIAELREHIGDSHFLVVDGNSNDETVRIAKSLNVDVIYQEGRGKGDAIAHAIRHVNEDVDYVVLTDADYTYPAEVVPRMIRILEENQQLGMVCGNRFNSHLNWHAMRNPFYFGNRLLAIAHNILNGVDLNDPLTGLRVVRWNILKDWKPVSKGFDIETELNYRVETLGYQILEIDIHYRPRLGEKKLKLQHGISILQRMVVESLLKGAQGRVKD